MDEISFGQPVQGKFTCEKIAFDSYADAIKVVRKSQSVGRVYGKTKRRLARKKLKSVYKCPDCGKYHMTSMLNRNKSQINKTIVSFRFEK
jgi:ribosomal protein L32